jgi:hypothetical protein
MGADVRLNRGNTPFMSVRNTLPEAASPVTVHLTATGPPIKYVEPKTKGWFMVSVEEGTKGLMVKGWESLVSCPSRREVKRTW